MEKPKQEEKCQHIHSQKDKVGPEKKETKV